MKKRILAVITVLMLLLSFSVAAYGEHWLDTVSDPTYAYSFAVVGDTQVVCERSPEGFAGIYDWLLQNIKPKKMQMVIGLGDITENKTDRAEWELAYDNIMRLHGKVPLSLIRGNHDDTVTFNNEFYELAKEVDGAYEKATLNNSYKLLTVGDTHYLILALDYGPSDAVLDWANTVCEQHPGYNVIVTTHGYLNRDGKLLPLGDKNVYGSGMAYHGCENGGEEIWNKFVSLHKNIVMVLCGHVGENGVEHNVRIGKNGNPVLEMLINPQSIDDQHKLTGMVAMLYFTEDGKSVTVQNYSTIQKKFYGQPFTAAVNVVSHTHAAVDTAWQRDASAHYQVCPCGERVNQSTHTFANGACVCGETQATTATTKGNVTTVTTTAGGETTAVSTTAAATVATTTAAAAANTGSVPVLPIVLIAVGVLVVVGIVIVILRILRS